MPVESVSLVAVGALRDLPQHFDQGLNVRRAAVVDDLRFRRIRYDACVRERLEDSHDVVFGELQREEVLAHHDVVVFLDAAQRIAIGLARVFRVSRSRPIGRRDLQHDSVAVLVPRQHALGMACRRALGRERVAIELVVPEHKKYLPLYTSSNVAPSGSTVAAPIQPSPCCSLCSALLAKANCWLNDL